MVDADQQRRDAIAALRDDETADFVVITATEDSHEAFMGGENGGRGSLRCLTIGMMALGGASENDDREMAHKLVDEAQHIRALDPDEELTL